MSDIVLEPAAQQFADATSKEPFLFQLPPEKGRAIFDDVQKESIQYKDGITTELIQLGKYEVKLIKPSSSTTKKLPIVYYIHGGGWVFGSPDAFGRLLGEIAKGVNAAVFAINYTRSPEAKYPTALDQIWETFEYILKNGEEQYNVDTNKIVIAGDSVGGNMSAITALRDQGKHFLGQALLYPVCDFSFDSGSYNQFAKGFFLQRDAMKWFFDQYTNGTNASADDPKISVLRTNKSELAKAPPALILTAEADVLRDHGEQYAYKLRQAGVQVTSARLGGIIHDFLLLDPVKDTGAAKAGRLLLISQLKEWLA